MTDRIYGITVGAALLLVVAGVVTHEQGWMEEKEPCPYLHHYHDSAKFYKTSGLESMAKRAKEMEEECEWENQHPR